MAKSARGFTLLELMVTATVIGVLSSVAIPEFLNYQLRSRRAERKMVVRAVKAGLDDIWARDGRFPNGAADDPVSTLSGDWNPGFPPVRSRRPFLTAPADWNRLNMVVEGGVFFTYFVYARQTPAGRYYLINTASDLDGNGVHNLYHEEYTYAGTTLTAQTTFDNVFVLGEVF
jgi:prepilin-type N-terminal cleavage/methylation domain-containing protein